MRNKKSQQARVPLPRPSLLPPDLGGFITVTPDGWRMDKVATVTPQGEFIVQRGLVIHIKKEAEDVYTITREIDGIFDGQEVRRSDSTA